MKTLLLFGITSCISIAGFNQNLQKRLDSLFLSYYSADKPGAAMAIEINGKSIFKKGYGLSNLDRQHRISSSTVFNIGSLTKQFTAYSILKLAAEHRLSLNDNLLTFFPQFNKMIGSVITVKELLSHCSGILDHYDYVNTKGLKHATDQDVLKAVQNVDSTYFQPGSRYRYSNTAYCLLGMIIEKASGMPYRDYLKKNIFMLLGMSHSQVWTTGQQIPDRATGYDTSAGTKPFSILDADQSVFFSTEADGGICTSIDDYLKWIQAIQTGIVLNKDLIKQARSPQFIIDSVQSLSYGFGWFVKSQGKQQAVYHTGSNGGFRAITFTIPYRHDAIVIFSNRDDIDLEKLLTAVLDILHINDKYFTKINSLVSFNSRWPNFAPCKETPLYSISYIKNLSASDMALN
jgi:CubicO group peptidase (beta-lactamase class C family)